VNTLPFLLGQTGGLTYHAQAFRYRKTLWRSFIQQVEGWLCEKWLPLLRANSSIRKLILFGPSAGWTLCPRFVESFETVICVEPDLVARSIFARRFRGIKNLRFVDRADLLPWLSPNEGEFEKFLNAHPDAAILFSNVLGQIPLLRPSLANHRPGAWADSARARRIFARALEGRHWASYHDVLSSETPYPPSLHNLVLPASNDLTAFAESLFDRCSATVIDHDTNWLGSEDFGHWEIRPGVHHVIGFTCA
jgi:hypothetical protein